MNKKQDMTKHQKQHKQLKQRIQDVEHEICAFRRTCEEHLGLDGQHEDTEGYIPWPFKQTPVVKQIKALREQIDLLYLYLGVEIQQIQAKKVVRRKPKLKKTTKPRKLKKGE